MIVLVTVTASPENGGTDTPRNVLAMQAPVLVPWNGEPVTCADTARPEGANVTLILVAPPGSSGCLQPDACAAAIESATLAAA